ncbi:AraC family transcriptional regulator (plasmid) [Phaeobacter inhibens]|uniref:AraC family transcriptional regulator n=1 Tax=Phaeobacter inhibens TaxID=221822 RepID=UPI000163334E|nr:AraC family transcriptional regulator [Phaeobacter inhibens]AFO93468.1 putative transcriptional regulator, AraC family [Phaeobacter inhibens DSM 17395]AUQ48168.1 putative transcriptional regulator, AraC family [Phaeobacter inhibens]AXT24957.1 AraC family transcriptional regulator [Phaeobacter inhibens]
MKTTDLTSLATVSSEFIEDWLNALRTHSSGEQMSSFLSRSGMTAPNGISAQRITLDQIFRLYQIAAVETGDEMMGLWNRPIRARALQHLLTAVREASSLTSALYRFSTFWNLLLDDYQFELHTRDDLVVLELRPIGDQVPQRFGHMLILKLAHGLMSWLVGHEVPVKAVQFAFGCPEFAEDYATIFPASVDFGASYSSITFERTMFGPPHSRSKPEVIKFLRRAPRDWIFTSCWEHTQSLQIREFLYQSNWVDCQLVDAARALRVTPRTLMRRLDADGTSFQAIKDGLRRDIAIRDLQSGQKSTEEISQDVGFSTAANFHRAFKRWTGATPSSYRRSNI